MNPVKRSDFGLKMHLVRSFAVTVPAGTTIADIENTKTWENVAEAYGVQNGSEVRVQLEDMSAIHIGIVTYAKGSTMKVKVVKTYQLDKLTEEESSLDNEPDQSDDEEEAEYFVKFRGPKKWGIIKSSDASVIAEDIDTKPEAEAQLKELLAKIN